MAKCDHAAECRFYKKEIPNHPANADELIAEFCEGNSLRCARSMVFDSRGDAAVPDDLMPEDKVRAYGMLAES
jgi:hypothetical protein